MCKQGIKEIDERNYLCRRGHIFPGAGPSFFLTKLQAVVNEMYKMRYFLSDKRGREDDHYWGSFSRRKNADEFRQSHTG